MVKYLIQVDNINIPIYVVNNSTWGGSMQTIIHESAGTNGGVVITTGRNTNKITLNGKLMTRLYSTLKGKTKTIFGSDSNPLLALNQIKNYFLTLKDNGTPITLITPVDNNDSGRYIISSFNGNVLEGQANYLPFIMELTEYKQVNIRRSQVNLISFEPAEEFKKILKERELIG